MKFKLGIIGIVTATGSNIWYSNPGEEEIYFFLLQTFPDLLKVTLHNQRNKHRKAVNIGKAAGAWSWPFTSISSTKVTNLSIGTYTKSIRLPGHAQTWLIYLKVTCTVRPEQNHQNRCRYPDSVYSKLRKERNVTDCPPCLVKRANQGLYFVYIMWVVSTAFASYDLWLLGSFRRQ